MERRTYLGLAATAAAGGIAGCTAASDGSEYPPYPDSETTELSGDGPGTSDSFDVSLEGPTLIEVEHQGSEDFVVALDNPDVESTGAGNETAAGDSESDDSETTGNETATGDSEPDDSETEDPVVATVVNAIGPYDGRTLHAVAADSYVLRVLRADDEWNATIYDLPVYDDGVGVTPPIERESQLYDVVGPINFGEQAETDFSFEVTGNGTHQVFLADREGTLQQNTANLTGDGSETATLPVGGVGYVELRTTGAWTLEISQ